MNMRAKLCSLRPSTLASLSLSLSRFLLYSIVHNLHTVLIKANQLNKGSFGQQTDLSTCVLSSWGYCEPHTAREYGVEGVSSSRTRDLHVYVTH